jgi:hypothetical protein
MNNNSRQLIIQLLAVTGMRVGDFAEISTPWKLAADLLECDWLITELSGVTVAPPPPAVNAVSMRRSILPALWGVEYRPGMAFGAILECLLCSVGVTHETETSPLERFRAEKCFGSEPIDWESARREMALFARNEAKA